MMGLFLPGKGCRLHSATLREGQGVKHGVMFYNTTAVGAVREHSFLLVCFPERSSQSFWAKGSI